jgi:hypothetical protein
LNCAFGSAAGLEQLGVERPLAVPSPQPGDNAGTCLRQFISPILLILLVATITSAVLGDWIDTAIILFMILGSVTLSFVREYRANSAAEKRRAQEVKFTTQDETIRMQHAGMRACSMPCGVMRSLRTLAAGISP